MQGVIAFALSMAYTYTAVFYVQTVGLNALQLVLIGTALEASYFSFEVPTGVIADTYSRRLSVILGTFCLGATLFVVVGFGTFAALLLAQVISGIGYCLHSGAIEAWVADEVGEAAAGPAFVRGSQASLTGAVLGPLTGALLASGGVTLPILVGGGCLVVLGIALSLLMPEGSFRPNRVPHERHLEAMSRTLRGGIGIVRSRPVVATILALAFGLGAFSEGLDRLWEAHLLTNIGLPTLGSLAPVVWFGLIGSASSLLGLGSAEVVRRTIDLQNSLTVARSLLALESVLSASVIAFALAGSFQLALVGIVVAQVCRATAGPLYTTWLNQHVPSDVRATVISLSGQANALGQMIGGPGVGLIGTVFSLRAALATAGALLLPNLVLYGRLLRRGDAGAHRD
jgi:MFS transporter, DHA3 family, tetracycline resistance protein